MRVGSHAWRGPPAEAHLQDLGWQIFQHSILGAPQDERHHLRMAATATLAPPKTSMHLRPICGPLAHLLSSVAVH